MAPHEIFQVDKYEDLFAAPVHHDENAEELNEEMTQRDKQPLGKEGKVRPLSLSLSLLHAHIVIYLVNQKLM